MRSCRSWERTPTSDSEKPAVAAAALKWAGRPSTQMFCASQRRSANWLLPTRTTNGSRPGRASATTSTPLPGNEAQLQQPQLQLTDAGRWAEPTATMVASRSRAQIAQGGWHRRVDGVVAGLAISMTQV